MFCPRLKSFSTNCRISWNRYDWPCVKRAGAEKSGIKQGNIFEKTGQKPVYFFFNSHKKSFSTGTGLCGV